MKISRFIPEPIKRLLRRLIKKIKFQSFKRKAGRFTLNDLKNDLQKIGIREGDVLYIHSSLKRIGFVEGGAETIIRAFMETVGPEGTLVFPTFTVPVSMFETLGDENQLFDPVSSPATTGKIPDTFRRLPGVSRSMHATHSVAAWGKHATSITADHYLQLSNFGTGTPFDKMLGLDVKVFGLAVGFEVVTYYHVFEDMKPELFRGVYHETEFSPKLKTAAGIVTYSQRAHSPGYSKRRIDRNPEIETYFRKHMTASGKVAWGKTGEAESWWMPAKDFMEQLGKLYEKGKTIYDV